MGGGGGGGLRNAANKRVVPREDGACGPTDKHAAGCVPKVGSEDGDGITRRLRGVGQHSGHIRGLVPEQCTQPQPQPQPHMHAQS